MEPDIYYKKTVTLHGRAGTLRFRVSQDLFSSYQVDVGTQFLLRTLAQHGPAAYGKVLDVGCGYGPLGIALKQRQPGCAVHMVDRDALAVAYARQNACLNGYADVQVYASLGYDDVPDRDFDLIVSNIPAKAGEPVIAHLLRAAAWHLRPAGTVAVVVVASLADGVAHTLETMPDIHLFHQQTRPGHTAFLYRFGQPPRDAPPQAFAQGVYVRQQQAFGRGPHRATMSLMHGLAEFDGPGYATDLLLEGLGWAERRAAHTVVCNPKQGFTAVAAWQAMQPHSLTLVDRDLLALQATRHNLGANGCPADAVALHHQTGVRLDGVPPADLMLGVLREDEGTAALAQFAQDAAAQLSPGGTLLVSGSSTAVTRLADAAKRLRRLTVVARKRWRGHSVLEWTC